MSYSEFDQPDVDVDETVDNSMPIDDVPVETEDEDIVDEGSD